MPAGQCLTQKPGIQYLPTLLEVEPAFNSLTNAYRLLGVNPKIKRIPTPFEYIEGSTTND